ncbi:MAG: class II aldolase/adducin family protein [Bacillota bacterium]|jgi:L-fuculose-phosphate aldolase
MIVYPSDAEACSNIIAIGQRMYQLGMVAANDGNISCRVAPQIIWATPTGVSKGFMTADMLIKLDLQGNIIKGSYKPSSELKMHLKIYEQSADIGAVTHAHPACATAFAVAQIPFEQPVMPEAVVNLGTVPVAPYATPGSIELAEGAAAYAKDHRAVLLANHGALSWGKDLNQAFFRLETLEHYAKILLYSRYTIGKAQLLPDDEIKVLEEIRCCLEAKKDY